MKSCALLVMALLGGLSGFAQTGYGTTSAYDPIPNSPKDKHLFVIPPHAHWYEQPWSDSSYLFLQFQEGRIVLKNGYTPTMHPLMNYSMLFETFVIKQPNGDLTSLKYSKEIKCIWIGNEKFVYTPHGYMHIMQQGKASLGEISFMNALYDYGPGGLRHGNPVSDWRDGVSNSPRYYYVEKKYYIFPDSSNHLIRPSPAALPKIFKNEKSKIKAYAKEHKTDYDNPDDLLDIISYCNREL